MIEVENISDVVKFADEGKFKFVDNLYGFSKTCMTAYGQCLAKAHPDLIVSSVHPGFIDTALTKGLGSPLKPD